MLPEPRERPWLTVAEVASITGEGEKAIRAAILAEQLPVLHIGRYVRIPTARLYQICGITPEVREPSSFTDEGIAAENPPPRGLRQLHDATTHDDDAA